MRLWRNSSRQNDDVIVQEPARRKRDRFRSLISGTTSAKPDLTAGDSRHDSKIDIQSDPNTELVCEQPEAPEEGCIADAESPTETTASSDESVISKSLWDQAYEALREDSKDSKVRIEQYEILLTAKLRAGDSENAIDKMIQSLDAGTGLPSANDIDSPNRRSQMEKILAIGAHDMDQRRLRLYIGSRQVIVGEQLAKMSTFIKWSQGWVGTAANLHPEATIAWAAISLALPLITNPVTAREAHAEGYKKISALTKYYALMESVYVPRDTPKNRVDNAALSSARKEVEEAIRDLYKAVLDFQIRSVVRFYRNRFKNLLRDVGQIDDWSELAKTIDDCDNKVKRLVQEERIAKTLASVDGLRDEWDKAQRRKEAWDQHFSQILEVTSAIRQNLETFIPKQLAHNKQQQEDTEKLHDMMKTIVDNKTREGLVNLLTALDNQIPGGASPDDAMARIPARLPDTANWVLTNDLYQEWLRAPSGLLLVSCPPGCGKSVLSKYLIDEALVTRSADLLYFFFDQHTIAQALCSILHQLFKAHETLAIPFASQFEKQPSLLTSHHRLWNILKSSLNKLARTPSIVFDAIDQCKEDGIGTFLQERLAVTEIHMAITTRPFAELTSPFDDDDEFPAIFRICGEKDTSTIAQEVQIFIKHEIKKLGWPDSGKRLLEDRMTEVDNPTYLWARLIFEDVQPGKARHFYPNLANIKKLVSTLPRNLEEAYDKIMNLTKDPVQLRKAMSIIIAAQRPLTLHEMNMAMHVFPETTSLQELEESLLGDSFFEEALRQWCGSFIIIQNSRVFLLHETAREFFTTPPDNDLIKPSNLSWKGSIASSQAHFTLAESCMRSLLFSDLRDPDGEPTLVGVSGILPRDDLMEPNGTALDIKLNHSKYSFIIYASIYWGPHVRRAGQLPANMHTMYEHLCDPAAAVSRSWLSFYLHHERSPALAAMHLDKIGVQCLLGHLVQVQTAIDKDPELLQPPPNRGGSEMIMPLMLAAIAGKHGDLTRWLLLEKNVSPNDCWGPVAPLVLAIEEGDSSVLDLIPSFLEKGAKTGMVELEEHSDKSPLWAAANRGLANVADLILNHEKSTGSESTISVAWTTMPLQVVRDAATTRVLLKHGAYPGYWKVGVSPLSTRKSIEAKLVIIEGFKNSGGAESELLEMLLEALSAAETDAEVALYFEHGLTSFSKTERGKGLLFRVSKLHRDGYHHEYQLEQSAIMQELLRHCDPEARNKEGLTALQYFVGRGASVAALVLLSQDVNIRVRDDQGRTILHLVFAPRLHHSYPLFATIIRALRKHQDILHAQDTRGWTALHNACESGLDKFVRHLLDEGLDIEARTSDGMTPLMVAVQGWQPWEYIPTVLLERGADLNAQDDEGRSVLHILISRNSGGDKLDHNALTAILDGISDPNLQDNQGRTPLICFVDRQIRFPNEQLSLLLDRGAACGITDHFGRQVLHYLHPACDWSAASIRALVQHGGDVAARTPGDETALHSIMLPTSFSAPLYNKSWYQPQIATSLLEEGAEVDAKRQDGKTPLHLACLNRCYNTARVLLKAGADASAVDGEGRTPLDLVQGEKRRQRFETLLSGSGDSEPVGKSPLREPQDAEEN